MNPWVPSAMPPVQTSYVQLAGGLDLVSPALQLKPGTCIDACNFVPETSGGYKRVGGYERFDGRPKPSEADYWILTVAPTAPIVIGDTLTGGTSSVTAKVLSLFSTTRLITGRNSGDFTLGETLYISGAPVGTISAQALRGSADVFTDLTYANLAAADRRADIQAVPGEGSVLGVWVYDGKLYAFRNKVGGASAGMYYATTGGWVEVSIGVTQLPGGSYEFVNYNFTGAAGAYKMYGCDGKNKAFEFDGTTFTRINSTATPDTPSAIAAHQNRLFLAILGSLFASSPGNPTSGWAGVGSTPAEIGTGDLITCLVPLPGDGDTAALAVYGRNKTSILYGYSTETWVLRLVSGDAGALPRTAQYVSTAISLDDRGATTLATTQDFGNFAAASVSALVQPFVNLRRGTATAASVLRSQDHYRLYFSDGWGLVFWIAGRRVQAIMPIQYPNPVACMCSNEDLDGQEVAFFGSTNGFVYRTEVGTSFDGEEIESWIRLAFNAERGPTVRKRWRRAVLEMLVPSYAKLYMTFELDYGDYSIPIAATSLDEFAQSTDSPGSGGFWDQFTWDQFTWDSPYLSPPRYDLYGTSSNISLLFFSKDALSAPFTLQSVLLHYTPRRLQR